MKASTHHSHPAMCESDAALPTPTVPSLQLPGHSLLAQIGATSSGPVYHGYVAALHQHVLIQELLPEALVLRLDHSAVQVRPGCHASFAAARRHFVFETQLLSRFASPGLLPVIGLVEANGTVYRVSPLRRWETLLNSLRRSQAPYRHEAGMMRLLSDLAVGYSALHARNCFHGWLNPATILVSPHDPVTLTDLGCAGFGPGERGPTGPFPDDIQQRYAAPEALRYAGSAALGPWTDVYCVASVLHHWVCGQPPTTAHTRLEQDHHVPLMQRSFPGKSNYNTAVLRAIDLGLSLQAESRPRSFDHWLRQFPRETPQAHPSRAQFVQLRGRQEAKVLGDEASGVVVSSGGVVWGAGG